MLMVGTALRQRAATAALLIPLTVAVVLWLPTPLFALCLAVVVLFGAWEWAALAGLGFHHIFRHRERPRSSPVTPRCRPAAQSPALRTGGSSGLVGEIVHHCHARGHRAVHQGEFRAHIA